MLSAPAFFLFIAGGLAASLDLAGTSTGRRRALLLVAGWFLLCFVGVTSGYAVYNAYFDIDFLKDDFRSAARFIEENKGDNEAVILTSGHFFPVFQYYYEGDDWYPIPDEPTLSAEHVLDYGLADELNRILPGRDGVWVLLWQHDVVDPVGFLTGMLGEEGELVPYAGGFWGLKLLHYALPPDVHFSSEPSPEYPLAVNFDDRIMLLGYTVAEDRATTNGLEVVLHWQALKDIAEDLKVSVRLRDAAGHEWGAFDGRPTGLLYPTFRWSAGETLFGTVNIAPRTGTPPGLYQLQAGVYSDVNLVGLDILDEQGTPTGTAAKVGGVELCPGWPASAADVHPSQRIEVALGEDVGLVGYDLSATSAQPGDALHLNLYWQVTSPAVREYVLLVRLQDESGQAADEGIGGPDVGGWAAPGGTELRGEVYRPASMYYPTSVWRSGEVVLGQHTYRVPLQAMPGQGELWVSLLWCRDGFTPTSSLPGATEVPEGQTVVAFKTPSDAPSELVACRIQEVAAETLVAGIEVETTERVFSPPEVQHRVEAGNLGGKALLYGYDLSADLLRPGDTLYLTLHWQALAPMETPYTVFTHLLDENNQVRGQMDGQPQGGARPTTGWVPLEYVRDEYQLEVHGDAPPGDYLIEVGMYDASTPNLRRLPLVDDEGYVLDNRIVLDSVLRVETH
jgi:hypothetical protein